MKEAELIAALNNRYAVKKFDPNRLLTDEQVNTLVEATRLTPTSYGLQLMKTVVVKNPDIRAELMHYAYGQHQIKDASHLFILCRERNVLKTHISDYISTIASTRAIEEQRLDGFKNMMHNTVLKMQPEEQIIWMEKQVYIALGNLLTSCAVLGVDSCPMEGFIPHKFDEVLGLTSQNLTATLVIPIGYRAEDDKNASIKKVRRSVQDFLIEI